MKKLITNSIIAAVIGLLTPFQALGDGNEIANDPQAQQLMELFNTAEKEASGSLGNKDYQGGEKAAKQATKKPSSDELIFALADKVDELREKTVIHAAVNVATQKPRLAKPIGSKTMYSFKEGDIYEIRTGLDRVTDISLQPGENLTNAPVAGDTVRWTLGIVKSGIGTRETTHIIIKPLDTSLETNIILTTDKRVYHLRALSGDWYMPTVSWRYPAEQAQRLQASILRNKRVEPLKVTPEKLNFNYKIDSNYQPWSPARIFDDGHKTYIQMPSEMAVTEAPALFIIENSEPMLVNYRVKGDFYIVDRLFKHAQLRAGTKNKVDIYDNRFKKSFFERLF